MSVQAIRRPSGFSLIEILVVIALLAILAAYLMPKYLKGGTTPSGKKVDSPMQRAHLVECASNLRQIRAAWQMATSAGDENRPQSLADLKTYGVSEAMQRCPTGGEPYAFNAPTGRISCSHTGHESL